MCDACNLRVGESSEIPCFCGNRERAHLVHEGRGEWYVKVLDTCVIPVKFCPRCGRELTPSKIRY